MERGRDQGLLPAGGSPWLACGYLVVTAAVSVAATLALKPTPLQAM